MFSPRFVQALRSAVTRLGRINEQTTDTATWVKMDEGASADVTLASLFSPTLEMERRNDFYVYEGGCVMVNVRAARSLLDRA